MRVKEDSTTRAKLNYEVVAGLVVLAGSAAGFAYTFGMYPEAAMFPRFILGFMALLSICMVVKNFHISPKEDENQKFFICPPRLLLILALMLAYIVAVSCLGYYTSTLIFFPCTAYSLGFRNKLYIAVTTLLYLLFVYLVFNMLFSLPFPKEFFQP